MDKLITLAEALEVQMQQDEMDINDYVKDGSHEHFLMEMMLDLHHAMGVDAFTIHNEGSSFFVEWVLKTQQEWEAIIAEAAAQIVAEQIIKSIKKLFGSSGE